MSQTHLAMGRKYNLISSPARTLLVSPTSPKGWDCLSGFLLGKIMPRIRTIKPEFPQSESMGRVSRESRYCFILLWTLADDSGRLRGNSRMLASLLYPYDEDAGKLIDKWLAELEQEKCLARYSIEGDTYIQICNWLKHQKIDRPSTSKIPEFDESSRILANPRDGIKDQGRDQGRDQSCLASEPSRFDEIRRMYPKRGGGQKWGDAERAYNARLSEGSTHEQILSGVERYSLYVRATGKEGTEYVQQAATFLGRNKGFLETWAAPAEVQDIRQMSAVDRVKFKNSQNGSVRDERVVSEQGRQSFGDLVKIDRFVR